MPEPLSRAVVTTTTMDANLNHCLATGKSLTGCLHFVNKTPVIGIPRIHMIKNLLLQKQQLSRSWSLGRL